MKILRSKAHSVPLPNQNTEIGKFIRDNNYDSYEQYISHQSSKFNVILHKHGGFSNLLIVRWRLAFYDHFKPLQQLLNKNADILCVGARQGTEVEVLHDLGFRNSKGCDLNPGPDNPYVYFSDFMNHELEDESVDAIFSNAIDHAFDLELFFKEQSRILKKEGYVIFDFADFNVIGGASDYESQSWESTDEPVKIMRKYFPLIISDITKDEWRTVISQRNH